MANWVLMDNFNVSVFIRRNLPRPQVRSIRRTLDGSGFKQNLQKAVQSVFNRYPSLRKTRVSVAF